MSSSDATISNRPLLGDRYETLSSLGSGAAADVFRVRDVRTGALRAAKVLKPANAGKPGVLSRFEDEFRILRTLHHPHLPEVYDYGWMPEGGRYLVMELVEGEPLDRYFQAHPEDMWVMLYELCETLVFVHAHGLLHQDIKPSNILVVRTRVAGEDRPLVKLLDFGLTYRRDTGAEVQLVGTAEYVAPEVVRGDRTLTRAVDYYSLGATLFELLCGRPPFEGNENEVLRAHLEREPVIEREALEWAELYPHVRALLGKDAQARLAAFEDFRRAVIGRMTGGIDDLDRSYALARIDSLGMIGKTAAWEELRGWLNSLGGDDRSAVAPTVSVAGSEGVGKGFLAGAFRAEASVRGVRTLSPSEIGWSDRGNAAARQPAMMWSRLLEACEAEPVVLVVERPMSLPDEERSFVRLAGTQWELYRSQGRTLSLYFLVVVDSNTDDVETLDYLPSENARQIGLAALTDRDREDVVAAFRGSLFDSRDALALARHLERCVNISDAIQTLQQAVLRSALTFEGQRWKVHPELGEMVVESGSATFARDLVASLSDVEQKFASIISA
ncbi:MAG TPA: serine/threonine-protein kinase, partial [Candidatus Krumholzibacteria bacterium]|nr:serine/threonine-protein kinase [Candidatus Krumholzibacteria bacterium]